MGNEANKCYSWIAEKLAEKRDEAYSMMMISLLRIKLIINSKLIMCTGGTRLIKHDREKHNVEELESYSEARCNITWLIKEKL